MAKPGVKQARADKGRAPTASAGGPSPGESEPQSTEDERPLSAREIRALKMLNVGNRLLLHVTDESTLLDGICSALVEVGGHALAWVGYAQDDAEKSVRAVAMSGERQDYINKAKISWGDTERGQGPTGRAIRTGRTVVNHDFQQAPAMAPWREGAREAGVRSSIAIPLTLDGGVRGALAIYSALPGAFDANEVALLEEFAADLTFGVNAIRTRAAGARAEAERALKTAVIAAISEAAPIGMLLIGPDGRINFHNQNYLDVTHLPPEALTGTIADNIIPRLAELAADPEAYTRRATDIFVLNKEGDATSFDEYAQKSGRIVQRYSAPVRLPDGTFMGRVSFVRDVTQERSSERSLKRLNRALLALSAGNEALMRAANEADLLNDMCQVMVRHAGYPVAWVGAPEPGGERQIKVIAAAGDERGYLRKAVFTWRDDETGQNLPGLVMRSGVAQVSQILDLDERMASIHRAQTAQDRLNAGVAFPLSDRGEIFAVLTILSGEAGAFDDDEFKLLQQLADDLAYGIRSLRARAERETAVERWRTGLEETIIAIAGTMEMRDPYTAGHQLRVAQLASAIATDLNLPEEQVHGIYLAGLIHDIGKITVPSELLSKPGRLSPLEYQLIQTHAQAGYDVIKGVDFPWPIAKAVLQHHERLDGSGYPNALRGDQIVLEAKILAVADVVEAMMSHRPYRAGLGLERALVEITEGRGRIYDPAAVDACLKLFREKNFQFPQAESRH